jgi:hypothetical protein
MIYKDALEIYDDLLLSGKEPKEAHAEARAIIGLNRVTPEEFQAKEIKIREDFSNAMGLLIQKVDIHFKYMGGIGASIFIALIANMILSWVKQ